MYMIFDAMMLDGGESKCSLPLRDRLPVIAEVVSKFREKLQVDNIPESTLPFSVIGKKFWPKDRINTLFSTLVRCVTSNAQWWEEE